MRRGALLMAILAALLLGAPSAVLAAPPNRLEAATAEPTTGTPLTTFHFAVRYISSTDSPASGVSAQIGPLEVPLHLASGTATDGIWSGSALLPVGTWSLTYQATTDEGPIATLAGPTLKVVDEASPSPEVRPGGEEPAPTSGGGADVDQPSSAPAESPEAEPKAPGRPTPDTRTQEPARADGGQRGNGGGSVAGATPQPAPRSDDRASDGGRRKGGAAPLRRSPEIPAPEVLTTPVDDPALSNRRELLLLLGAIVTVATVALLGTGWLLASREREDERAGDAAGASGATVARADRRRRARATAGVQPAYDPVLAALGLDEADGADGAAQDRQRSAARGAAPRPRKAPRGPR